MLHYDMMRDELMKIARRNQHKSEIYGRLAVRYGDDVARRVMRIMQERRKGEKRAGQISAGPEGFLSGRHPSIQTSPLDAEGRLRTNYEPNAPIQYRKIKKIHKREKPGKLVGIRLLTSGDLAGGKRPGDYEGREPLGVDRSFHANHENVSIG